MSTTSRVRRALPLFAAAATLLTASQAMANNPPDVAVNGAGSKELRLGNPVQLSGLASDTDGIKQIFGTIKSLKNNKFITGKGGFSDRPARLQFNFTQSTSTRWQSQSFNLPNGKYEFNIRVEDKAGDISPIITVPFTATGGRATALANNQTQNNQAQGNAAAPRIAIQFPKKGQVLKQAAAFSGIARDDQAVAGVIATVMNQATGQFLQPNGRFARKGQLQIRTAKSKSAQWTTPQINLPPGDYLLSVKAVDNNGQEGQWVQTQFSVAGATQQATINANPTPVQPASGALAANGMAYCGNRGLDADGDGFGWQNQASCVVRGSKADKHPTCASSASDPDGDGYGWENEKSCIVVVHCASAASDPDGDGFGWENQRSCVVLNQANATGFRKCANGRASDPDGDGYGWENNATCLVK